MSTINGMTFRAPPCISRCRSRTWTHTFGSIHWIIRTNYDS